MPGPITLPGYWTPSQAANYLNSFTTAPATSGSLGQVLPGTLTGASPQSGSGSQGAVPRVPDPATTAAAALRTNLGLGQDLTALGQTVAAANAAAAMVPFNLNLPYFGENWAQGGLNVNQLLRGELPEADVNALINSAIGKMGLVSGLSTDSPAVRSALARTVLGSEFAAQQKGLEDLKTMMGMTPTGPAFDASSMLVKPSEMQDWQYLANVLAASPNPDAAAWANLANVFAGMRSGGAGGTKTQDPLQSAALKEMQDTLAKWEKDRQANLNRTTGGTTVPTPFVPPKGGPYGGLSVSDEERDLRAYMLSLGYDPYTGAEIWPSDYYGGTDTTNYYDYTPEEGQYWPGPY